MYNHSSFSDNLAQFQVAPTSDKAKTEYGEKIAKSLLADFGGSNGYLSRRNLKIEQNNVFAKGNQSMQEFLDFFGIDGKNAYVNLDLRPLKIVPKFLRNIVARFMEREERPQVQAIDLASRKQKQKEKDEAEYRMRMGQQIQAMEMMGGLPLEDKSAYTPTDEDDLEFYFEEEWQDFTAIKFQEHIFNVLQDNKYEEFKRKAIRNLAKHGFISAKVYKDSTGRTKIRLCLNQNMVYGYSERDDFEDNLVVGERRKYKISEFRLAYPNIDEKKVFEYYQKSVKTNTTNWDEAYRMGPFRYYDDATIDVLEFEVKAADDLQFLMKTTKNGKTLVFNKLHAEGYGGKTQEINKKIEVVYRGCYIEGCQELVLWELQRNMIKPHHNLGEVLTGYVIQMPNNDDMEPEALLDGIITPIRMMCLTHLKIQQLVAKMRPDGYAVDIRNMAEIDLGNGPMNPLQLQSVADQTGIVYYEGMDEDGETRKDIPIKPLENNNAVSKLQSLIQTYNFYQEQLRDTLGVNEYTEGASVNPKLGLGVLQNQVSAGNRSTEFLYEAYIDFLNGIAKRISILEWYSCIDGKVADISAEEMRSKQFDINISMLPTETEKAYLNELVNSAMSNGLVTFEEAFKIRNIAKKNVKHAEKYLGIYEKRRKEFALQERDSGIRATGEEQRASNQQTHQNALQLEEMKGGMKIQVQDSAVKGEEMKEMAKFARDMMLESFKLGKPLPENVQMIVDAYLQTAAAGSQLNMAGKQMEGMAMEQQMQQVAEQQQQPQQ
jgi:hypothetical protein